MIKRALLSVLTLLSLHGPAQTGGKSFFENYQALQSEGVMPFSFLASTTEKYEHDRKQVEAQQARSQRMEQDVFYLKANYLIDKIRYSGDVILGDTVSRYINKVADKLLANDPKTRAKVNFVLLREPYANAFSTDNGDIFVNIGLISRLQNEAQLAFILAHEIIHFKKRHVLSGYLHDLGYGNNDSLEGLGIEDEIQSRHCYSIALENEADREGYELFVAAGYDPQGARGAFQLLMQADYPFSDSAFKPGFFETGYLKFPQTLIPQRTGAIEIPEDKETDTHPATHARLDWIDAKIAASPDQKGDLYKLDEESFKFIRTIAQFEELALWADAHYFDIAMYEAYSLLQEYPQNYYLERQLVRAMYGDLLMSNHRRLVEKRYDESNFVTLHGGQFEYFQMFISGLGEEGKHTMYLAYAWNVWSRHAGDSALFRMNLGIIIEARYSAIISLSDYKTEQPVIEKDSTGAELGSAKEIREIFWTGAFAGMLDDAVFKDAWKEAKDVHQRDRVRRANLRKLEINDSKTMSRKKWRNDSDTLHLNQESLIAMSPEYIAIDLREGSDVDLERSVKREEIMQDAYIMADKSLDMNIIMLGPAANAETSVESFNVLMYSTDWFYQSMFFEGYEIKPVYNDSLIALATRTNTNYIAWSAGISIRQERQSKFVAMFGLGVIHVTRALYFLATPRCDVFFYSVLLDIRTGEQYVEVVRVMPNQEDNAARIEQNVYDFLYQIDRK
jgi:hypothetical protein